MAQKAKISGYIRAVALCFSPYKRTRHAPFHKKRDLLRVNRERAYSTFPEEEVYFVVSSNPSDSKHIVERYLVHGFSYIRPIS